MKIVDLKLAIAHPPGGGRVPPLALTQHGRSHQLARFVGDSIPDRSVKAKGALLIRQSRNLRGGQKPEVGNHLVQRAVAWISSSHYHARWEMASSLDKPPDG